MKAKKKDPEKCRHLDQPKLTYAEWFEDAKDRRRNGEIQRFCLVCGRYIWDKYWKVV